MRNHPLFSVVVVTFYILTSSAQAPISPHPHKHLLFSALFFLIVTILMDVVASHCRFDSHLPSDQWYWASIFSHVYWPFVYLSSLKEFYSSSFPILKLFCLLLTFRSYIYVLDVIIYQIYDLQIFSPICGLLF